MMQTIASLFVQKPLNILAVAMVFAIGYFILRFSAIGDGKHPTALLVPTATWALFAVWEWLIVLRTPEANIRVDLLLILPVLLVVSVWFSIRAFR